jgi:hypothetical protein
MVVVVREAKYLNDIADSETCICGLCSRAKGSAPSSVCGIKDYGNGGWLKLCVFFCGVGHHLELSRETCRRIFPYRSAMTLSVGGVQLSGHGHFQISVCRHRVNNGKLGVGHYCREGATICRNIVCRVVFQRACWRDERIVHVSNLQLRSAFCQSQA